LRDDKTQDGSVQWTKYREDYPAWLTTGYSTHTFSRTQRDEIIHQPYVNGFRHSTNYKSFFGKCIGYPYNYTSKIGSRYYVHHGTSSSGRRGGGNLYGWGTTNVAQRTPVISSNAKNRVTTEALAKVPNGDFQLGIMIAEAKRTYNLVVESTLIVLRAWHFVRRREYHKAAALLRVHRAQWMKYQFLTPAKFWLAIQYGWRPLLRDIYGLIEALKTDWSKFPPTLSVVKRREWRYPGKPAGITRITGGVKMGLECKLYYTIDNDVLYFLSSIGVTNPAVIAWELVPFSFVFDWFVPIGTWLQAMSPSHMGVEFIGGYRTGYANAAFNAYFYEGTYKIGTIENLKVEYRAMSRERIVGAPLAVPYVKWGFTSSHSTSAIALVISGRKYHF